MGLSTPARAFLWGDGLAAAGQDLRLQTASAMLTGAIPTGSTAIAARQGVRPAGVGGGTLSVSASSGMNISVNPGVAFVQGTTAANSGMYTAILDTAATITVATSDPTNPRIDNVIVQITDNGNNTSTAVVTLQTGTAAPSPSPPALPANSLLLATVAVAANTSTIVAGNITDGRLFTVASGGILPVSNMAAGTSMTGTNGMYVHDTGPGRLRVNRGNGVAEQPRIAAFAATTNTVASATATTAGFSNAVTLNVTVDGNTELCIFASWPSIVPASGIAVGDYLETQILIDGAGIGQPSVTRMDSTSLNVSDGGNIWAWSTPGAGTHTFALACAAVGHNFTINNPFIRIAPSLQQ